MHYTSKGRSKAASQWLTQGEWLLFQPSKTLPYAARHPWSSSSRSWWSRVQKFQETEANCFCIVLLAIFAGPSKNFLNFECLVSFFAGGSRQSPKHALQDAKHHRFFAKSRRNSQEFCGMPSIFVETCLRQHQSLLYTELQKILTICCWEKSARAAFFPFFF